MINKVVNITFFVQNIMVLFASLFMFKETASVTLSAIICNVHMLSFLFAKDYFFSGNNLSIHSV